MKHKHQEKKPLTFVIADENGLSLWCYGRAYLIDEQGREISGGVPMTMSDSKREKMIALAEAHEQFLQKELVDIKKVKAILLSLKPKEKS